MNTGFYVFMCFIPLLAAESVLFAVYKKAILIKMQTAVLVGLLVLVPTTLLQTILLRVLPLSGAAQNIAHILLFSIGINGFIEETCKAGALFALPQKKIPPSAFFALSVIAGLSFGCFETVIYLIKSGHIAPLRLITAVVLHGLCSGLTSFTVLPLRTAVPRTKVRILPYVQAVLLHGLYNFFSVLPGLFRIFPLLCLAAGAYKCWTALQQQKNGAENSF